MLRYKYPFLVILLFLIAVNCIKANTVVDTLEEHLKSLPEYEQMTYLAGLSVKSIKSEIFSSLKLKYRTRNFFHVCFFILI